ncbi:class I SAM-dependent methyltransferase [Conexibacter sp. SYSU D00693]|uniref:class I SAM-dependent methyltransferase n=1 Tax=Conexibacter sp. SYSU D00693 TaxID=2812560 RepID=UPI00196A68FE|nr:class I SAM-dependent methyltransferase [Conexibacter sp. SYSU D00693]
MSRLFAAIYDRVLAASEEAGLRAERAGLLAQARGDVVELGAGTGLNLEHYDRTAVGRLVLTEPDPHMAKRLRERVGGDPAIEVVEAGAERLPLEDDSVDTVVATLVLCTIPDPEAALREAARVLRPGGRLLALEHVRSEDAGLAKWQDRLERPWGWVAGGCHPNRNTRATLEASPLRLVETRATVMPKATPLVRPAMVAVAEV